MTAFYPKIEAEMCIQWIKNYFTGPNEGCNAVIGISGGKDSTIAAALCVEALGADRVIGVMMPNGAQSDIQDARDVIEFLGIKSLEVNIKEAWYSIASQIDLQCSEYVAVQGQLEKSGGVTKQAKINLSPRLRMSTLFAVAQSMNGRVCCTSNYSEYMIGYFTMFGDSCGHFAPLRNWTATEVIEIGKVLDLPNPWVIKPPSDGISGKSDEDAFGFTYKDLDRCLRGEDVITANKDDVNSMESMIVNSEFKRQTLPEVYSVCQIISDMKKNKPWVLDL